MNDDAGAEAFVSVEGNMCGAVMRGPVALPGSKATSRKKGTRWNLGDLTLPAITSVDTGRDGKSRRRSRRGRGEEFGRLHTTCEASNNAGLRSAAEMVEGRRPVGGKVSSGACSGLSAGISMSWNSKPTWPLRAGSKADGWTRSTSDKSPARESRTPGSVGEVPGNRHLYPTARGQRASCGQSGSRDWSVDRCTDWRSYLGGPVRRSV